MKYRFLNHTADAQFQAYGNSLEEAFQNAAEAMASLMWSVKKIKPRIKRKINARGRDEEQLLLNFLEEILYLLELEDFLFHSVEDIGIKKEKTGYYLGASFLGDKFSDEYEIFGMIKAVTYNDMIIKKNDHYMIQVVVDI